MSSVDRDTIDRHTLEYLADLYDTEPTVRDVWTEGASDASILQWLLNRSGVTTAKIRHIDEIDCPPEGLASLGLTEGCRSKVIFAANRIAELTNLPDVPQVTFVADRDRHDLPSPGASLGHLLFTDYRDFEMYLCNERALEKVSAFLLHEQPANTADLLARLRRIARVITAYFDARAHGWQAYSDPGVRGLVYSPKKGLAFDEKAYRDIVINSNGGFKKNQEFLSEVERRLAEPGDDRLHTRGHTFCEVLGEYISVRSKTLSRDIDGITKAMVAVLELVDLVDEPMFKRLIERAKFTEIS